MRIGYFLFALALSCAGATAGPDYLADCTTTPAPVCHVATPPDPATLAQHLGTQNQAWWLEKDRFTVAIRNPGPAPILCCALQGPMTRAGDSDIWSYTAQSPNFDAAIIDIFIHQADSHTLQSFGVWRGPTAPPPPATLLVPMNRYIERSLESPNLGEARKVYIYLPPGYQPGTHYPVIYMADGQGTYARGKILEALIGAGKLPPVLLVGLASGSGSQSVGGKTIDRRSLDYLVGVADDDRYFRQHETFLLQEVIPLAEREYGASPDPQQRLITGNSSGAAWALQMGLLHPDTFPRIASLSVCWRKFVGGGSNTSSRLFIAAGTLEGCYDSTARAAERAKTAGMAVTQRSAVSGHSSLMWDVLFAEAVSWAFPPPANFSKVGP